MHFHLPKPLHGWREFAGEVGIIVIGVLIALSAEQAIEWLHWRHEARLAREALAFDFRRIIGEAAQTDAFAPCLAERVREYSHVLDGAETTKRLAPVGFGGTPLFPPWNLRSWSGLTSGQVLAHMSNRDQLAVSGLTVALDWERSVRDQQSNDWAALTTIIGPGRAVSETEIANLRATLARVARETSVERTLGVQLETEMVQSGFLTHAQAQDAYQEGLAYGRASKMCRPPEAPPADASDALIRELMGSPTPPGRFKLKGVGVHGALTTEN